MLGALDKGVCVMLKNKVQRKLESWTAFEEDEE